MPKYHVHVYPVVRVLVPDVEAGSQEEACQKAEAAFNWEAVLRQAENERGWPAVEYADDIDGFLVDEEADTEHKRSTRYEKDYTMSTPKGPQPTPIEGTLVWECSECNLLSDDAAGPIFECDDDGLFNVELSSGTNQCPKCAKFAKNVGEQSCIGCNEGEVSQITAITCTCCDEWHKVD